MLLRCSGCGDLVSEWAARCPLCRQDTRDAELVPEPLRVETGGTAETGETGRVVQTLGPGVPDIFAPGFFSSAGIIPVAMSRPMVPFGGQAPRASPTFARMVPLTRSDVACALDIWWAGDTATSQLRVQHRLELGPPRGDPTLGWTFKGRVRRLTTLHWVPVVIELWPVYDDFVKMTMTPQVRVLASKRYYRLGHAVLDRLWADLVETSSHV
jgi:hypothetical protein